jgi:tRNA(Ile)-lysidine synthase
MGVRFDPGKLLPLIRLPEHAPSGRLLLACSGGLDSTVLLQAVAALRDAGALRGWSLQAVHVHHGLQQGADDWAQFCRRQADTLDVDYAERRLQLAVASGESEEAVARKARYEVLDTMMRPGDRLLTAHHVDDQLETVLLALARGAGPAGLAAMAPVRRRGEGWHLRPLLGFSRAALADYARVRGLSWIDDPTNGDIRLARAYLRREVLPALYRRWPGIAASASRSARLCGASDELNSQLARQDLALAPGARPGPRLAVDRLTALDEARGLNALRFWIRCNGYLPPPERRLRGALHDLIREQPSGQECVPWKGAELRRYRDRLYLTAPLPTPARGAMALDDHGRVELAGGLGVVRLVPAGAADAPGSRLSRELLAAGELAVVFRAGGERLRLPGREGTRRLKRLLQEWGIVPWMRSRLPLLTVNGDLAAVADLGVSAAFAAREEEAALVLRWEHHPPIT